MCGFNGVVGEYSPDNINDLKQKSLLIDTEDLMSTQI